MKQLNAKKTKKIAEALGYELEIAYAVDHRRYKVYTKKGSVLDIYPNGVVNILADEDNLPRDISCPWLLDYLVHVSLKSSKKGTTLDSGPIKPYFK
jgi:hypothetical protein